MSPRATPPAVFRLAIDVPTSHAEAAAALLFEAGAAGLEEHDLPEGSRWIVYGVQVELERMGRDVVGGLHAQAPELALRVRIAPHDDAAWETAWLDHLEPQRLSDRFVVYPQGREPPADDEAAIVLAREPAFGFGEHATTRLAAGETERYVADHPGSSVLDFGTGTGVLAIAAVKAGAGRAMGLDLDPAAVGVAIRNASLNGVAESCRFTTESSELSTDRFDLVVANLDPRTLIAVAPQIAEAVGHRLIVTGFVEESIADITAAFHALVPAHQGHAEEWAILVFERR